MKFQESMMHWWMGRKNPEELEAIMGQMMGDMMPKMRNEMGPEGMATMMGDMIPQMMEKMGPEDMPKMMGGMTPQMMEKMGHEAIEHMILNMMPVTTDNCFSAMDKERRVFMLTHCRSMLDQMEEKYVVAGIS